MKRMLICTVLICSCFALFAQPRIRTEESPGGGRTDFILEGKDRPGTLSLYLTFSELRNCNMNPGMTKFAVKFDQTRFLTLRASDESYGVKYRYTWQYYYAPTDAKPDTTFVYRMPCSTKKPVPVLPTVYILDKYRKSRADQKTTGHYFILEKGDTVYASRKGIVVSVDVSRKKDMDVSFTTQTPTVLVEHQDGSIMQYYCLEEDNIFVKPGDEVLPSTPLALAGTFDGEHYKVGTLIYWYTTNPDPEKHAEQLCLTNQFLPVFATTEGNLVPTSYKDYTPVMTDEMITREMNKKEMKKYREN